MEALTTETKETPLPGYQIGKLLYKSSRSLYFLGHPVNQKQRVLIRFLKKNLLSADDIARFKEEYRLLKNLSAIDGVPVPINLETSAFGPAMLVKYFDGRLLADILKNNRPDKTRADFSSSEHNDPLDQFLSFGISLTTLVDHLHSSKIIHQQIQPENIVWDEPRGLTVIIDFSSAKTYTRPGNATKTKDIFSGNLAYIAPEQTGRINRSVDFRTDFYAMGVIFYEMLTGSLPFAFDDPMQLVHAHLAQTPVPPDTLNPEIPGVISSIILKLMAKNPADRYQSAHGVLADLNKCREQLKTQIIDFDIGQEDISDRLTFPRKIFGRDTEVKKLMASFERASTGNVEAVLITGAFGIGKSRLVEEIVPLVRQHNGFFISSEFDRLKQDIPYASLMEAFQDLIRQILTLDEDRIQKWREALIRELGDDCGTMAGLIPELESITGMPPVPAEFSTGEGEKKFHLIIKKFISVFASAKHPLVIFMDNLQWADTSSLLLMENLAKPPRLRHCLCIGAYRESDIQESWTRDFLTAALTRLNVKWDIIDLGPLPQQSVNQLVATTLSLPPEKARELSTLINNKTGGNPFFVFQFIKTLYGKALISYEGAWQFDLPGIAREDITENLADFMAMHLQQLPEKVLAILQTAACIGVKFSPDLIVQVTKHSHATVTEILGEAIQEGMLVSVEDGLKFTHDRVRDAAYAMMEETVRMQSHLDIGRALLRQKNANQIAENIFEIVFHLNKAIDHVTDSRDRTNLAGYNLTAAMKAKTAGVYQPARRYLKKALMLLPENSWQKAYELTLQIHNESCEVAYLNGDQEAVVDFFNAVLANGKTPLDKVRVYEIKIAMLTTANQAADAIALSIDALNMLGMSFPKQASKIRIIAELMRIKWLLRGKTPESLLDLHEMMDIEKLICARILMRMLEPCYIENPDLFIVTALKLLYMTLKHGNSVSSIFAYATYGSILCGVFGDYVQGREYADLAIKLTDKLKGVQLSAKVNLLIGGGINHWTRPIREDLNYLMNAYTRGLETGDHSFASYALTTYMYTLFFLGNPLDTVSETFSKYFGSLKNLHQESSFQEFLLWYQLVENLKTASPLTPEITGHICSETDYVLAWEHANDLNRLGIHNIGKMILYYLCGEFEACLDCAKKGEKYLEAIMGQIFVAEYYFYYSLALISAAPGAAPKRLRHYVRKIKSNQKKFGKWARFAPENFEHKYLLINAGLAAIEHSFEKAMILFNASIAKAARNGFLQDEAIASEMAGSIWHALGNTEIAAVFMTRAHRCYHRWGASAKLYLLEMHYPELLKELTASLPEDAPKLSLDTELSEKSPADTSSFDISALDVETVVKAAQTVSEEIILDRLIHQLVRLNIETAGAEKGVLLLKENERFTIRAVGQLKKNSINVSPPRGSISDIVPVSLIRFVGRTGETVLLADASKEKLFSRDPYIVSRSPKSVICLPVAHQHHLTAVMYLENSLSEGVFTLKQQEILKIIASQAAISIDNAFLYEELKDTEQRLNNLLKTANEGFVSIDLDAVITDVNPEMCRILGQKRENCIGRSYFEFLDDQGAEMVKSQLALRRQGKKGAYDIAFTRPEGTRVDCLVKAAPLYDKAGKVTGSFAMVTDITERKRAESELMRLNRELEERVRKRTAELEESLETLKQAQNHLIKSETMAALGGLVAGVTHEINTPIGMGMTANSYLEEKLNTLNTLYRSQELSADTFEKLFNELTDASRTIKTNLKRAVELVGSFKEIAVDQSSEERRRFNVKDYLGEVLMSLQPKFKGTRHEIITVCPEHLDIISYPGKFSQILTNLIINSLTHAFENTDAGEIEIRLFSENDHLVLVYRDNGSGMPPDAAQKIFDPFFTTRRSFGGAGLGMFIVYNIVTQTLGGQIQCNSAPGEGVEISIRLPIEKAEH